MGFCQLVVPKQVLFAALSLGLLSSCIHKKYETPITKNTQQPDKVLFDQAINDIEHGRYEVARISLQTLMNTYESSEYMAKAKLAIADSWFREAGPNGMAQAEAEYKDFELFYPQMEESAEAQNRICEIHFRQMDKSDRDWTQTLRAETECRSLIQQYPNSKFVPSATQKLLKIQESLGEHEFVVGNFYWRRDMNPAAANRLTALVDQYPLYSKSGESLYEAGDSYSKMGPRFRKQAGEQFAKVVRDYPTSPRADQAKLRLEDMEMPVPNPDPAAVARGKAEEAAYKKPGLLARTTRVLGGTPDVSHAASQGQPTMTAPKATIPASIPVPVNTEPASTGTTDVSATQVGSNSALETRPDARTEANAPAAGTGTGAATEAGAAGATGAAAKPDTAAAVQQPLPTNRDADLKKLREQQAKKQAKLDKKKKKKEGEPANTAASQPSAQAAVPSTGGSATPASAPPTQQ